MFDVVCIGILVADVIVKPVNKIPEAGKLGLIDAVTLCSGGCAMSAAVDMAKIGAAPALIGKIGEDGFGAFLSAELSHYGVDITGLIVDKAAHTSASAVLVDGSGERTFLHSPGANGELTDTDVDFGIIEKSKIVFIAGTMLMPSFDGAPCSRVLKRAKEMGKITVLDTAWDDQGRWMEVLEPSMPYLDYFIPSIEEATQLSGESEPGKIAACFFEKGVGTVVIKLGKNGCFVQENKTAEGYYVPTYSHIKAVDTTGAGDSFCAGFLYGLSQSMSILDCAKFANAVGTHCVMAVGATTGIKSYREIRGFMDEVEKET